MSTKIYEGLKLRKNMTFFEVNELLRNVRAECKLIQTHEYNKRIAKKITSFIDDSLYCNKEELLKKYEIGSRESFNPLFSIMKNEREMENEHIFQRPHCEIFLFPVENEVLCMVFGDSIFDHLFYTHKNSEGVISPPKYLEFEEFGYWNNSELPDNVTEKEWEYRKNLWDKALKGIGVPVENGIGKTLVGKKELFEDDEITIKHAVVYYKQNIKTLKELENGFFAVLNNDNGLPSRDEILKCIDNDDERLESLIKRIVEHEFEEAYSKSHEGEKFNYSHYIKEFRIFKSSIECETKKEALKKLYESKIKNINPEWVIPIPINDLYK